MSSKNISLSERLTSTVEGMRLWQQERAIFEVTERICALMQERQVTRAELARRLGATPGYITQLLDGTANMTIRKISDLYLALNREFVPGDRALSKQPQVRKLEPAPNGSNRQRNGARKNTARSKRRTGIKS
jgi:transcriptional regulator with XRE-family HTH domain